MASGDEGSVKPANSCDMIEKRDEPATKKHRGIPEALFLVRNIAAVCLLYLCTVSVTRGRLKIAIVTIAICMSQENVDGFMKKEGNESADSTLKNLDEQHQKYKFMELNLLAKKRR